VYTTAPAWNQTSLNILKYLPYASTSTYALPTLADGTDICGRVQYSIPNYNYDNQFITRVDFSINQSNHLYGRYMLDSYQFPPYYSPTNILLTTQQGNPEERVQTGILGWDTPSRQTSSTPLTSQSCVASTRVIMLRELQTHAIRVSESRSVAVRLLGSR
jgi:hypothetical protein